MSKEIIIFELIDKKSQNHIGYASWINCLGKRKFKIVEDIQDATCARDKQDAWNQLQDWLVNKTFTATIKVL